MSSSSASQTSGEVRCSGWSASRGRPYSRTSAAVSAARSPPPGADEALDQARQAVRRRRRGRSTRTAERARPTRRAPGCRRRPVPRRVRETEQVAVRHAVPLPVLDRLVGERVDRLRGVPAPTARRSERPQPRKPSTNVANWNRCVPVRPPAAAPASAACRVAVSPRPAASASAKRAGSFFGARPSVETRTISATARGPSSPTHRSTALRVLARQRPLGRVVRAALRAEHEEAAQPRPVIDRPGVAAGRVRAWPGSGTRCGTARAVTLQVRHGTSFRVVGDARRSASSSASAARPSRKR